MNSALLPSASAQDPQECSHHAKDYIALPAQPGKSSLARQSVEVIAAAILLTLVSLRFPNPGSTSLLDQSWSVVLGYAFRNNLQLGKDIAFTFGPLGFLSFYSYLPTAVWGRFALEVVVCSTANFGFCLLVARAPAWWRAASIGALCVLRLSSPAPGIDLCFEVALLCWGLLSYLDSGKRQSFFTLCLCAIAVLAALTKFTLFIMAALTMLVTVLHLTWQKRLRLGSLALLLFMCLYAVVWVSLGQALSSFIPYLSSSLFLSEGYNQAMAVDGVHTGGGLVLGVLAFAALPARLAGSDAGGPNLKVRKCLIVLWAAGLGFLTWKHGVVRADEWHYLELIGFMPVLALTFGAVPSIRNRVQQYGRLAALCCTMLGISFGIMLPDPTGARPELGLQRVISNLGILLRPTAFVQRQMAFIEEERGLMRLPTIVAAVGKGRVDVFGQLQICAVLGHFNYQPRPVFQSYSAFNRWTANANERFYRSESSPDFVLLSLRAIDSRLPALEDSLLLRYLLCHYELAAQESPFLLLRKKADAHARLALIAEGDINNGQKIHMDSVTGAQLWLEVQLRPTWLESIREAVYKPSPVRLRVWKGTNVSEYYSPRPMLATGFVASPLLTDNAAMLDVFENKPTECPSAYSVELGDNPQWFWHRKIHFRLFRIDNSYTTD